MTDFCNEMTILCNKMKVFCNDLKRCEFGGNGWDFLLLPPNKYTHNMKNVLLKLLLSVASLGVAENFYAQDVELGTPRVIVYLYNDDVLRTDRHRTPDTYYYLPETTYSTATGSCLNFTGVVSLEDIYWWLEDARHNMVYSSRLTVHKNETVTVPVEFLSEGDYFVMFRLGGETYSGAFTK